MPSFLTTTALLTLLLLHISSASPVFPRQSADDDGQSVDLATCVAIYPEDPTELSSFNSGSQGFLIINSIALPDAGYLSTHESEDDDPEDDVDPNPSVGDIDAAAAAGIDTAHVNGSATTHDKRGLALLSERSGSKRLFQATNYRYLSCFMTDCRDWNLTEMLMCKRRAVAEGGLIIMLSSVGGGAIGVIGNAINNLPALPPGVSSWW